MASSPTTPMAPPAGAPPAGGAAPPPQGASAPNPELAAQVKPPAQMLAALAMSAQKIAELVPETAPMMREVDNQVRMATMKMIQQRAAQQQAAPQI